MALERRVHRLIWGRGGSEVTAPSVGLEIKVEIFDWLDFDYCFIAKVKSPRLRGYQVTKAPCADDRESEHEMSLTAWLKNWEKKEKEKEKISQRVTQLARPR